MSCLHRYWAKEFFRFFFIIQTIILVVFVIIDYLSRMDKFLTSDIGLSRGLWYVILKLPFMFVELTPASVLLSTIVVFALMSRNQELTIIRSAGISGYYLLRPALVSALGLSLLMFFLGETLIPMSMGEANHIRYVELNKKTNMSMGKEDIWIKSEKLFIHIAYFDPVDKTISGISITSAGFNFTIQDRLFAQKGFYINQGNWRLEDIFRQTYDPVAKGFHSEQSHQLEMNLQISPQDLGKAVKKTDEMSFSQLQRYVNKVESEGYNATMYRVDMHAKPAFVCICIIMAMTGTAIGLRPFARDSLPLAITSGLVIAFSYWVMFGLCLSLGYSQVLPPFLAAWITNIIFAFGGCLFLMTAQ